MTFAEVEYEGKKWKTRREKIMERMDGLIPWKKLEMQLAKKYSKGKVSRKPYPLSVMLSMHVMQLLCNLSDPSMKDAAVRDRVDAPLCRASLVGRDNDSRFSPLPGTT